MAQSSRTIGSALIAVGGLLWNMEDLRQAVLGEIDGSGNIVLQEDKLAERWFRGPENGEGETGMLQHEFAEKDGVPLTPVESCKDDNLSSLRYIIITDNNTQAHSAKHRVDAKHDIEPHQDFHPLGDEGRAEQRQPPFLLLPSVL